MIFKKQVYWVVYLFLFTLISILIVIGLVLPYNYFIYSPVVIIFLSVIFGSTLFYQFLRANHRLIITDDVIKVKGFFIDKEIKIKNIEGFETYYISSKGGRHAWYYYVKEKGFSSKGIKINRTYKNQLALTDWIKNNLIDLNKLQDDKDEVKELKKDVIDVERIENNPIKRAIKVKSAKRTALVLNTLSIIFSIFIFIPFISDYLIFGVLICLPLLTLCCIIYYKGFLRLNGIGKVLEYSFSRRKKDIYIANKSNYFSDVSLAVTIPSVVLFFYSLITYDVLDLNTVLTPYIILLGVSIVLLGILFFTRKLKITNFLVIIPFVLIYSYGVVITTNCVFDSEVTSVESYRVTSKRLISKKQGYYYRINVINWLGEAGRYKKLDVSEEYYESIGIGDNLEVDFKNGFLNIPWYEVVEN